MGLWSQWACYWASKPILNDFILLSPHLLSLTQFSLLSGLAMGSLTLSSSLTRHSLPVFRRRTIHRTPPSSAVCVHNSKPLAPSIKCSLNPVHHQTLSSSQDSLLHVLSSTDPQTPESAKRAAEADVMGLLLKERIVFLGSEIDDFVADAIISQLLLLDAKDPKKDIRLFINSPGGSLSATMAIFDVVRLVRADISTVALGICASTASIILGGGTKNKRLAMPNTRIMMHQPLGGASGQAIDVDIQAKELINNKKNVIRIISEFSGRSTEQVEKDIDRDKYMSPIEAVEYGIIDGVIDRDSIIPLEPVPEKITSSIFQEIEKGIDKFLVPEVPDDELY